MFTSVLMRTKLNTAFYYRVTCDSNIFLSIIILLSDGDMSDKQLTCRQHTWSSNIFTNATFLSHEDVIE